MPTNELSHLPPFEEPYLGFGKGLTDLWGGCLGVAAQKWFRFPRLDLGEYGGNYPIRFTATWVSSAAGGKLV